MPQSTAYSASVYSLKFGNDQPFAPLLKIVIGTCRKPVKLFQLVVVVGLGVLSTFMQYEFYHKHDVLPGYAWPLALAGSLAMIAMLTLQLSGVTNWIRKVVCGAYYLFMVISTSFHVFDHTWKQVVSQRIPTITSAAIQSTGTDPVTLALTDALRMATKARAFSTIRDVADKLSTPQVLPIEQSKPKSLGFSRDEMDWIGAGILIALRALLEGAQVLCVIALKDQKGSNQERKS